MLLTVFEQKIWFCFLFQSFFSERLFFFEKNWFFFQRVFSPKKISP